MTVAPVSSTLFTVGEVLSVMLAADGRPLADARDFRRIAAGSESTVAAGLVRLGHRARLVTVVGQDALGDGVERMLSEWGVTASVNRSDRPTGAIVRAPGLGGPSAAVHLRRESAATELSPTMIDAAWRDDIDAVFITGITAIRSPSARAAVRQTVERARSIGALVVVDPNVRLSLGTPQEFAVALDGIRGDIAIGDPAELAALAQTDEHGAADALLASGYRLVVTKHGEHGATARDGSRTVSVPSRATVVRDTVGAGDAFAAGLIAATLEGASIEDSLELASVVAAAVVGTLGDVEGFPERAAIDWGVVS